MSGQESGMTAEACAHCPHKTGVGSSQGWAGQWDVVCCNCGARGYRPWSTETQEVAGHGPHFRERITVHGEPKWYPPLTLENLRTDSTPFLVSR